MGRLAPTPSGRLHLGNALAFLAAWLSVRSRGGRVLLRIEDADTRRARPQIAEAQRADLIWLGLEWDEEVPPQSTRRYDAVLSELAPHTYRCRCTRKMSRAVGGGCASSCPSRGHSTGAVRFRIPEGRIRFEDRKWGWREVDPAVSGDPVLCRADGTPAYNLAVVADDRLDGVTEVTRGADLLDLTAVQLHLWRALGSPPPHWLHTPLVLGADGRKLSKSHGASHLGALREAGWRTGDVHALLFRWLGLEECRTLGDAIDRFQPTAGPRGPIRVRLAPDMTCPPPETGIDWVASSEDTDPPPHG